MEFISIVVNPIGITELFIAAMYFTILAIFLYQQMHKNEEIGEAGRPAKNAKVTKEVMWLIQSKIEAKAKGLVTEEALETALRAKADKTDVDAKLARKADASAVKAKLAGGMLKLN